MSTVMAFQGQSATFGRHTNCRNKFETKPRNLKFSVIITPTKGLKRATDSNTLVTLYPRFQEDMLL